MQPAGHSDERRQAETATACVEMRRCRSVRSVPVTPRVVSTHTTPHEFSSRWNVETTLGRVRVTDTRTRAQRNVWLFRLQARPGLANGAVRTRTMEDRA